MRDSLLKKQKELLELQQKKLEIELLQTKARLQQQQVCFLPTTSANGSIIYLHTRLMNKHDEKIILRGTLFENLLKLLYDTFRIIF